MLYGAPFLLVAPLCTYLENIYVPNIQGSKQKIRTAYDDERVDFWVENKVFMNHLHLCLVV